MQLVELVVHVHPLLESDQMPRFDPAGEDYTCTGIIDCSVSSNLPEAFHGEIREDLKSRRKCVFHRMYRIIYKICIFIRYIYRFGGRLVYLPINLVIYTFSSQDYTWNRDKCPVHRWAHVPISTKTLDNFDFADNIYVTITNALISALYISDTETIRWQANFPLDVWFLFY
jgi:hypothetical protein